MFLELSCPRFSTWSLMSIDWKLDFIFFQFLPSIWCPEYRCVKCFWKDASLPLMKTYLQLADGQAIASFAAMTRKPYFLFCGQMTLLCACRPIPQRHHLSWSPPLRLVVGTWQEAGGPTGLRDRKVVTMEKYRLTPHPPSPLSWAQCCCLLLDDNGKAKALHVKHTICSAATTVVCPVMLQMHTFSSIRLKFKIFSPLSSFSYIFIAIRNSSCNWQARHSLRQ